MFCFLVGIAAGCDLLQEEEPEEQVIDDPFEEQEEEPEELEELPSSCEGEDSEDGQEEAESEPVEQNDGNEAASGEQYEIGDYQVIADGDYLLASVTKETTLKSSYSPADLRQIPSHMNPSYDMYLRSVALENLEKLWQAAKEDGVTLSIRSAYRSYSTQKGLFNDYASRHGEEEANRFSARPGQSEHQLGTAVDFGGTAVDFTAEFGQTPQGKWLAENAYNYGFALSYPHSKEYITGYIYEPWHYRYIGIAAAKEWERSGLTLREYLETRPQEFE